MQNIGQQLFEMMHRFRRIQLTERLGLLPRSEHVFLGILSEEKSCAAGDAALSAAEMARRLGISPPAVSRTVQALRTRGLIAVEADPADRRGTRIRLTHAGCAALQHDHARLDALFMRAANQLAPGELEGMFSSFDRLHTAILAELAALDGEVNR